jgi:hypothetical protein
MPHFAGCSTDEQFEFGLELMLRGIEAIPRLGDL